MAKRSATDLQLADQVAAVRGFNRFYTAKLGLLRRRHLNGQFALTEARILYEISAGHDMTASSLCETLELDAGYVSRLLSSLAKRRLLRQKASERDRREKLLTLTTNGERAVRHINAQSMEQIQDMLGTMRTDERAALVGSLTKVRVLLSGQQTQALRIERLSAMNDDAVGIVSEYYRAVSVVQRDTERDLRKVIDSTASGIWLAYQGDAVVGCVVLRKLTTVPRASECKRLFVRPTARGNGIAEKLLDVQEEFARSRGIDWIYLDSYDDLKAAIALYEKRGYVRCERYNDNPQATLFMRKYIAS
jgi:DNA-binding MarR family transcriptional regulator/GNAT superfamily N-acetyltransferase